YRIRHSRRNVQHYRFKNYVTHELKTPIASIRSYLETLKGHDVDEPQRRNFFRLMLLDTDRLLGTVEQVLKAGETGAKRSLRHATDIDLGKLVRECVELARTRHHLQPELLRYEEATENGAGSKVLGEPEELRTAITNILDNAIKYSGNHVDTSVQLQTRDDKHMLVRVRDRGVGITNEDPKRIFKRFYGVPHRSMSHVKGTGLG